MRGRINISDRRERMLYEATGQIIEAECYQGSESLSRIKAMVPCAEIIQADKHLSINSQVTSPGQYVILVHATGIVLIKDQIPGCFKPVMVQHELI